MTAYPLRHLSIRVPWHDSGWKGLICKAPHLNGACAKLRGIANLKSDEAERENAGKSLNELPRDQWPCCINERAAFMAPFEIEALKRHALAEANKQNYGHFIPTPQRYPAYSAGIVPFRWMMRETLEALSDELDLGLSAGREPELGYQTNWIHEHQNQTSILDGFAAHLRAQESLCFFYAKHVPFVEGTGRILIGAGHVKQIGRLTEYDRSTAGMRGMVWERPIQHSIRPDGQDGFLIPYSEILARAEGDTSLDLERYTAHAPAEHWDEFSYGSELVTHDGAIAALLALETVLVRLEKELGIPTGWQQTWLHDELVRLWKVRGPYPGLGAVLRAFGLSRGLFVAHALQDRAGENTDPWPQAEAAFQDPQTLPAELRRDLKELAPTWQALSPERRATLKLLSRFELTAPQAKHLYDVDSRIKRGWGISDNDLLKNPYRIYEISRHDPEGISLLTIDRGVFPDDVVRNLHPLDEPARLDSAMDARRVCAFAVFSLESAAKDGDTLAFPGDLANQIQEIAVRPACPVTTDILCASVPRMAPEIVRVDTGGQWALQLGRYQAIGALVRKQVLGRIEGARHSAAVNWAEQLYRKFGPTSDDEERRAREEKAHALAELSESRFAVLIGPAGAGKTTLLGILCEQSDIQSEGILLLAPTGKARVRMQELAGSPGTAAKTIAQFLNQNGRYDGRSGRYFLSERPKATGYGTVIVDEASMLTEDMFGSLLDALQGVKRLILVGDPAQLPPIGAGRPFADIIARLRPDDFEQRFPRVARGYAELTIERRQIGVDRPDLRLARWFSVTPPAPGDDGIFSGRETEHATIRLVPWETLEEFHNKLTTILAEELKLEGRNDQRGFNRALGAMVSGSYDYFNATRGETAGAVRHVEEWQILSPLRGMPFGVSDINRQIHERFRASFVSLASKQWNRPIPKPLSAERIVYGDKVINLSNHRRDGKKVYPPEGALGYLANGEIGIAVGQWKTKNMKSAPNILKVEFASQQGYTYDFYGNDFSEEGEAALELAYALTVHKAQGSQFGLVIFVLPKDHPILSRELIYTALTRHKERVVIMHQGPKSLLKDLAAPHRSETARRRTNLLSDCRMLEFPQPKGSVFLQEGLVHRTSKGLAVRSKSELLIAEALLSEGIAFEYEKPLTLGGITRYPDFTIEDEISGRTIYWEHLGMLQREEYRQGWERKLTWYIENGIQSATSAIGGCLILVTTMECEHFMQRVKRTIAEFCHG